MRLIAGLLAVTLLAPTAVAQVRSTAKSGVLVYDASTREFRWWREGNSDTASAASLCALAPQGVHPVTPSLYFVRGEAIGITVCNATIQDLLDLDVKVDDLDEPSVSVSGSLSSLPTLLTIPPLPAVFAGAATSLAAAPSAVKPTKLLLERLATLTNKDFSAELERDVLGPLSSKEVDAFLSVDWDTMDSVALLSKNYLPIATSIQNDVNGVGRPGEIGEWAKDVHRLAALINQALALRTRLVGAGLPTAVKGVNDALLAAQTPPLRRALAVDPSDLVALNSVIQTAFTHDPYEDIDATAIQHNHFQPLPPDLAPLSNYIPNVATLSRLKNLRANLKTLADSAAAIAQATERRTDLATIVSGATQQRTDSCGPYALQNAIRRLSDSLTAKASALNSLGDSLPLTGTYARLPVGRWFANKTITITVKQGQRARTFDVAGVADASRTDLLTGTTPNAGAASNAPADLADARTIHVPVYNTYHVILALGFAYSSARDDRFQVDKVTASGASATTQEFIDQTRSRDYTVLPTANILIFPWARNNFPLVPRYDGEHQPGLRDDFAVMGGFGVTNPTRDFLLGAAFVPHNGVVGIQVAWHGALRDYPPRGIDISMPDTSRVVVLRQRLLSGLSAGVLVTTDFFTNVLGALFKSGT